MNNSLVSPIAPKALEEAARRHVAEVPEDADAIDRLLAYLKTTRPTSDEILLSVCRFYEFTPTELYSRAREAPISRARHVFFYLAYKYTGLSMGQLAKKFGHADHTSVRNSIEVIRKISLQPRMVDELDLLRLRIAERVIGRPNTKARVS